MNTKQKGDMAERQCVGLLEKIGHEVMRAQRTMRPIGKGKFISFDNDYFNLYDVIALNPLNKKKKWIQVKHDLSDVYKARAKIEGFHVTYLNEFDESEVWQKIPRKGFIIHVFNGFAWKKKCMNLKGEFVESVFK